MSIGRDLEVAVASLCKLFSGKFWSSRVKCSSVENRDLDVALQGGQAVPSIVQAGWMSCNIALLTIVLAIASLLQWKVFGALELLSVETLCPLQCWVLLQCLLQGLLNPRVCSSERHSSS